MKIQGTKDYYTTLIIYGVTFLVLLHVAALGFWLYKVVTERKEENTRRLLKQH